MECTCNKPKLLHVPCSHVLASLAQVGVCSTSYVAPVYLKQNIELTWTGEFYGFMARGDFSVYNKDLPICLSPMELLRHTHEKGGRPQTRRIRNDMDESEVGGPLRRFRTCEGFRHKTVDYPNTSSALAGDEGASSSVGRRGKGGGRGRGGI